VTWEERLGPQGALRRELEEKRREGRKFRLYYWVSRSLLHRFIRWCVKASGLYARGRRNIFEIRVEDHEVVLDRLPRSFDGLRLLQLTDLHLDLEDGVDAAILDRLRGVSWDVAVVTGDYRNRNFGEFTVCMDRLRPIVEVLVEQSQVQGIPPLAILGNHDDGEMVSVLEGMGMRVLLNEAVSLEHEGDRIWIGGIDDSADFASFDVERAMAGIPDGECRILLSHAPDAYAEAADKGVDLMLSGHTHGGQICLPGGFAPLTRSTCPRKCVSGRWEQGGMKGYTSRGTGSGGVPVRFNCPPEITVHTLRSSEEHVS